MVQVNKTESYQDTTNNLPKGKKNQVLSINKLLGRLEWVDIDVALIHEIENDLDNIKNKLENLKQLISVKENTK